MKDFSLRHSRFYSKVRAVLYFFAPTLFFIALVVIGSGISEDLCGGGWTGLACAIEVTVYLSVIGASISIIGQIILAKKLSLRGIKFVIFILPALFLLIILIVMVIGNFMGVLSL